MINNLKKHKNILSIFLMVALSCITQIVTLLKTSILAGTFGVTAEMDAYNFANSIATFIFGFLIAGVSTVVIPCFVKKEQKEPLNSFLTLVFLIMVVITIIIIFFRDIIIIIITGKQGYFVLIAGSILIVLMLSNLFSVVTSVTTAYFQYIERYNTPKMIVLVGQIIVVVCLVLFKNITVYQYALVVGVGIVIASFIEVIFAIRFGWRYRPNFKIKEKRTKELFNLLLPILFSTGVYQISLMVDSAIATRLDTGSITVLSYSNQIAIMVNTLIAGNLLVYFYPKIVKSIESKKGQDYFWNQSFFIHAVMCLIIAGYVTIGQEGVSLLFEHGKFGALATRIVFLLSLLYILSQQFTVVRDLIYRYFYSIGDTKNPTLNSIAAGVLNIILSLVLAKYIGIYGIVLGTVVSSIVSLITIMIKFNSIIGYSVCLQKIVTQYVKNNIIMLAVIIVVQVSKQIVPCEFLLVKILLYGIETVLVYVIITILFNKKIIVITQNI